MERGRAYRSDRRILDFNIKENVVQATVRGNKNPYFGVHKEPKYKIKINFKIIKYIEWQAIISAISENPSWLSKLMLNEIPNDIDIAFPANKNLLPKKFTDVEASCSCPDYDNPCKHIAGIYYRLASMFDSQPMLLFPLHGLPLKDLQQELRSSDLGKAFAEQLSSEEDISIEYSKNRYTPILPSDTPQKYTQRNYWCMDDWEIEKQDGEPITASIIKKQGDYPSFWHKQNSFVESMENIYICIRNRNKKILFK